MLLRRSITPASKLQPLRLITAGLRWQSTVPPTMKPATAPVVPPPAPAPPVPPQPATPLNTEPPKPKSSSNASSTISLILASFILGAGVAYVLPLSEIAKLVALERLPAPDSLNALEYQEKLEKELHELALFKKLSADPEYESVRAWSYLDSSTLNASLTAGTLSVPGGFAIKPVIFVNKEKREMVSIIHVGQKLCGYPFLIHGGILAGILDEVLKRGSAFLFDLDALSEYDPKKIKTNMIELQYKFPTVANNFVVVKTSINEKGQVIGDIETLKGRLLVKGLGEFEKRGEITARSRRRKFLGLF